MFGENESLSEEAGEAWRARKHLIMRKGAMLLDGEFAWLGKFLPDLLDE
jgi:hypothetical protein